MSSEARDTIVFIPAWNEEDNLPDVLEELHAELPDAHVLVVDDGSTDQTAAVAADHGAEVLSFGTNRDPTATSHSPERTSSSSRRSSAGGCCPSASMRPQ